MLNWAYSTLFSSLMDYSSYTSDMVISLLEDPSHTEFSGFWDYYGYPSGFMVILEFFG